jgi:ribose transport system permease protein
MSTENLITSNLNVAWRRVFSGRSTSIVITTIALFLVSPLVAPGSVSSASLLSMLPFASVLAIIAAGQTLIVQQRGIDLSVPGMIALAATLVTGMTQIYNTPTWVAIIVGVIGPGIIGLLNGIFVSVFKVAPIVITLGMNAVLIGLVFSVSRGTPSGAANGLNQFALNKSFGIPNTLLIAMLVILITSFITQRTVIGRRLTVIGVSVRAATVLGHQVTLYQILTYGFAGICYGVGGVLLAGYIKTPQLFLGDSYLLPSIAAVVLGGTALTGGIASILSSGIAALFLTQLGQVLRSLGWPDSSQYIAQALVLVVVVVLREIAYLPRFRKKSKK